MGRDGNSHPPHCNRGGEHKNIWTNTTIIQNVTNLNYTINVVNNPSVIPPKPTPDQPKPPVPAVIVDPDVKNKGTPSKGPDAVYLVDLWLPGNYDKAHGSPGNASLMPEGKAVWFYRDARLKVMNDKEVPDAIFPLPNLPPNFDWEGFTIDVSNGKDVTLRIGVIEGASTIATKQLIPGDGTVRTVGSCGRYGSNLPYGIVLPVRRDELSTLIYNDKTTGTLLEGRCRYYASCARAPLSEQATPFGLPTGKLSAADEKSGGKVMNLLPGEKGDASDPNAGLMLDDAAGSTSVGDGAPSTATDKQEFGLGTDASNPDTYGEPPADEDFGEMLDRTVPMGVDVGDGETWKDCMFPAWSLPDAGGSAMLEGSDMKEPAAGAVNPVHNDDSTN